MISSLEDAAGADGRFSIAGISAVWGTREGFDCILVDDVSRFLLDVNKDEKGKESI